MNKINSNRKENMANIAKQSIKIELDNVEYEDNRELLEDTLYTAVSMLAENEQEEDILLTTRFFTLRFDETESGAIAATITASEKRGV
jgi:hypothetical protein